MPPEAILGTRTGFPWLAGSIAKWLNSYLGAQAPCPSITKGVCDKKFVNSDNGLCLSTLI